MALALFLADSWLEPKRTHIASIELVISLDFEIDLLCDFLFVMILEQAAADSTGLGLV